MILNDMCCLPQCTYDIERAPGMNIQTSLPVKSCDAKSWHNATLASSPVTQFVFHRRSPAVEDEDLRVWPGQTEGNKSDGETHESMCRQRHQVILQLVDWMFEL